MTLRQQLNFCTFLEEQAVSCRPVTMEARVLIAVSVNASFVLVKVRLGQFFSRGTSVFSYSDIQPMCCTRLALNISLSEGQAGEA